MNDDAAAAAVGLHIGAHKTATTHLQRSLLDVSDDLRAMGVQFHGPRSFRWGQPGLMQRFGIPGRPEWRGQPHDPQSLSDLIGDASRLLLSEENFIGPLLDDKGLQNRPLYPDGPRRIAALAERVGPGGLDVYLALRDPADFLNAAYGQRLRSQRDMSPADFIRRNSLVHVNWVDLVERVRAAPGVRSLTVWRYEDYASLFSPICAAMLGARAAEIVRPLDGRVHPGLSAAAVAAMRAAPDTPAPDIIAAHPIGPDAPKFDGYDAKTHALSDDYYAAQMDEIDAMTHVTRLIPTAWA